MSKDTWITRRSLLAAGAIGVLGLSAVSAYNPTTLRYLAIENHTDRRETLDVRVLADGDVVVEQSLTLPEEGYERVPCEWPSRAGTYRYGGRLNDESEWTEGTVSDGGNVLRLIRITDAGLEISRPRPQQDPEELEQDLCEIPWWIDEVRGSGNTQYS